MSCCELCGRDGDLIFAFVECVKFKVCSSCSRYGKVVQERFVKKKEVKTIKREEFADVVLDGCGKIIKEKREERGLNHKDLAAKLNERESTIAKIEQGSLRPDLDLAKRLEKFLNVKLISREKISETPSIRRASDSLTIGDFMKKTS